MRNLILVPSEASFHRYILKMIRIHPDYIYKYKNNPDQEAIKKFIKLDPVEMLKEFPIDFQNEIQNLWENANKFEHISYSIAKNIFELYKITGVKQVEISSILVEVFDKFYSKSYISKLCSAGEVLNKLPELENIKDIESLYLINKIKDISILKQLNEEVDLSSKSRTEINKEVNKILNSEKLSPEKKQDHLKIVPKKSKSQYQESSVDSNINLKEKVLNYLGSLNDTQLEKTLKFIIRIKNQDTESEQVS